MRLQRSMQGGLLSGSVFKLVQHAGDAAYSQCAQAGVSVKPKKGDALMFYNLLETGRTDGYSMHAGCPVTKGACRVSLPRPTL